GGDGEQERPAVEEGGQLAECLAQVDVAAPRRGAACAQLGEDERTEQRDERAECPRRHDEAAGADALRDDGGVEEDAGADDAADDEHRAGERADPARVAGAHEAPAARSADWRTRTSPRAPSATRYAGSGVSPIRSAILPRAPSYGPPT